MVTGGLSHVYNSILCLCFSLLIYVQICKSQLVLLDSPFSQSEDRIG